MKKHLLFCALILILAFFGMGVAGGIAPKTPSGMFAEPGHWSTLLFVFSAAIFGMAFAKIADALLLSPLMDALFTKRWRRNCLF